MQRTHRHLSHSGLLCCGIAATLAAQTIACQRVVRSTEGVVADDTRLSVDEAMTIRQWPVTTAYYAGGRTEAGSTGFAFEATPGGEDGVYGVEPGLGAGYALAEPLIFLANVVTLPFTLIAEGLGAGEAGTVQTAGVVFPPTHTAVPPLYETTHTDTVSPPETPPFTSDDRIDASPGEPIPTPATPGVLEIGPAVAPDVAPDVAPETTRSPARGGPMYDQGPAPTPAEAIQAPVPPEFRPVGPAAPLDGAPLGPGAVAPPVRPTPTMPTRPLDDATNKD